MQVFKLEFKHQGPTPEVGLVIANTPEDAIEKLRLSGVKGVILKIELLGPIYGPVEQVKTYKK